MLQAAGGWIDGVKQRVNRDGLRKEIGIRFARAVVRVNLKSVVAASSVGKRHDGATSETSSGTAVVGEISRRTAESDTNNKIAEWPTGIVGQLKIENWGRAVFRHGDGAGSREGDLRLAWRRGERESGERRDDGPTERTASKHG